LTGWFFQGSDNLQVVDEEKCNGCGICANACHEGAIDIVDGKAKLVRENFCGGLQRAAENAIDALLVQGIIFLNIVSGN
jgi:Fe-S-cluster-containing hydrogenase component 2